MQSRLAILFSYSPCSPCLCEILLKKQGIILYQPKNISQKQICLWDFSIENIFFRQPENGLCEDEWRSFLISHGDTERQRRKDTANMQSRLAILFSYSPCSPCLCEILLKKQGIILYQPKNISQKQICLWDFSIENIFQAA